MFYLPQSLEAWSTDSFVTTFKREASSIDANLLPLQQGLQNGSYALGDSLSLTVLSMEEDATDIIVKVGVFYHGVIAGCSCADDPTPVDRTNEYCDVLFRINRQNAKTTASLVL